MTFHPKSLIHIEIFFKDIRIEPFSKFFAEDYPLNNHNQFDKYYQNTLIQNFWISSLKFFCLAYTMKKMHAFLNHFNFVFVKNVFVKIIQNLFNHENDVHFICCIGTCAIIISIWFILLWSITQVLKNYVCKVKKNNQICNNI